MSRLMMMRIGGSTGIVRQVDAGPYCAYDSTHMCSTIIAVPSLIDLCQPTQVMALYGGFAIEAWSLSMARNDRHTADVYIASLPRGIAPCSTRRLTHIIA